MNYSLPFVAAAYLNGKKHPAVDIKKSVRQHLQLILHTRSPFGCRALAAYGVPLEGYYFTLIGEEGDTTMFLEKLKKELKESLKNNIKLHEQRLRNPKFKIEDEDPGAALQQLQDEHKITETERTKLERILQLTNRTSGGVLLNIQITGILPDNSSFEFQIYLYLG